MIKQVSAFQSNDGTLHSCEQDVVHHEVRRDLIKVFEKAGYGGMADDLKQVCLVYANEIHEHLERYLNLRTDVNPEDDKTIPMELNGK